MAEKMGSGENGCRKGDSAHIHLPPMTTGSRVSLVHNTLISHDISNIKQNIIIFINNNINV